MKRQEDFERMAKQITGDEPEFVRGIAYTVFLRAADYGYQYASDKYERLIKKLLGQDIGLGYANSFIDDIRKAMEE